MILFEMQEHRVSARVSGRCLIAAPVGAGPFPLLAGFHGYGQTAEDGMELLQRIPGSEGWITCAVEALHPFMNAKGEPGASWMTRRDRDFRIAENVAYVDTVLAEVRAAYPASGTIVLHGFSQGVGMACRAAVLGCHRVSAVMLVGGDVPPELEWLEPMHSVHLARGDRDCIYPEESFVCDMERLAGSGVHVRDAVFRGSHAPNDAYHVEAGRFLAAVAGGA
jgi:predicted esterase